MTLLELYEPLFQYICTFNRNARGGGNLHYETTRDEITTILREINERAAENHKLAMQAEKLRKPILYFVDSMIAESKAPFAREWNAERLAYEEGIRAGDQLFFEEELEPTLRDPSDDATERLAVFYVCLGLGFTGDMKGPSAQQALKDYSQKIFVRIKGLVETDPRAKITKEAYYVDERVLTEPPSRKFVLLSILFVCCALGVLVLYGVMYSVAKREFDQSVKGILNKSQQAKQL